VTIKVTLGDGQGTNGEAAVVKRAELPAGVVTYTEPYRVGVPRTTAAVSATYGADMNQNIAFSGSPDGIHDGTDSVLWTGSNLSGANFVFNSTAQARAGTKSVDATATLGTNEALFTRSSAIDSDSYTALSGSIYITGWATSGTKEVELRVRLAASDVGNTVALSNYIDNTLFNVWQDFVVPVADFGLLGSNMDELVVQTIDIGGGAAPDYYLDELDWQEAGGAETYVVEATANHRYSLTTMTISMADAYVSTLADATHQKLPYNTLLGVAALSTGIQFRLTTDDTVRFNSLFKNHMDFMGFPGAEVQSGGDGTNTWATYNYTFNPPFVLDSRKGDKLEVIINDNLSGLLRLRVLVRGTEEEFVKGENKE
jgi:hypothetical protein